jgi:hypothetical protein
VVSPNGGEELNWAESYTIEWTAPAHTDTVVLSFSADSAATWEEIASGEQNDGLYSWTVPEVLTDSALVKIEAYDAGLPIGADVSDDIFRIFPGTTVVVVSPNGGEELNWAEKQAIQWTAPAHTDTVVLSFSADSAATWEEIASGEPNDGYYLWTVPNVSTDSALVKVEAYDAGLPIGMDVSDDMFKIFPDTIVEMESPNGGETLYWSESHTIQWAAPAHTDTVVLSFSADSSATWEEIASGEVNDGIYLWTVPKVPTDSALVRVEAYYAGAPIGADVSDGLFTIRPDTTVIVISPNGGEDLLWEEPHGLRWSAPAHTDTVVLLLSTDNADTWDEIASGEPNDGYYSWTIPEITTDSALVKVDAYYSGVRIGEDVSDSLFTIRSAMADAPGRGPGLGDRVVLWQNAPNPWRSGTSISFYLPRDEVVYLHVFDAKGRLVDVLIDGVRRNAGVQTVPWDGRRSNGSRLGSGVYFYRLRAGGFIETKKMILAQ